MKKHRLQGFAGELTKLLVASRKRSGTKRVRLSTVDHAWAAFAEAFRLPYGRMAK